MYTSHRYPLELKMEAVQLIRNGMSFRQASKACGIPRSSIWNWHKTLDEDTLDLYACNSEKTRKVNEVDLDNLPDDPNELKKIIFDMQFEMDLKEALVDILKKDPGVDPKKLANKEKAILVDALSSKKMYSIGQILSYVNLAPATFYYHKKKMGTDQQQTLTTAIREICTLHPEFGYRRVKYVLAQEDDVYAHVSEKRIRRIMKQYGLQPSRRRKCSRYSSYDARKDTEDGIANVPLQEDGTHVFVTSKPNTLWVSDVTEFLLPNSDRVFLSPVLDCFDSSLRSWQINTSEKAEDLTNPSLRRAVPCLSKDDKCFVHTDRGGHYFSFGWRDICEKFNITRSMSRKGCSPDNARMEGFFGRLKMEFFDTRSWEGVSTNQFIEQLDKWLVYYNEMRPKQSLGWLSPMQYRRRYYEAA